MLDYATIIETVNMRFPEIQECTECQQSVKLISGSEDLPYVYFSIFWRFLETTLKAKDANAELFDKIFSFMEEMVESNDTNIVNLMQIEMLEPLFGLDYDTYDKVVNTYLLPNSLKLHKAHLSCFKEPEKPII